MQSALYKTTVYHLRHLPRRHEFRYGGYSCLFDLDELAELDQRHWFFSMNRPNLISFQDKDYGSGGNKPLKEHVRDLLGGAGYRERPARILLLTQPRVWGYVFNPLSVYYCLDEQDHLAAVIYEVNNTFGDRHSYVFPLDNQEKAHCCRKLLHVSPFFDILGSYRFRNKLPGEKSHLGIRYQDTDGSLLFYASLRGHRKEISGRSLLAMALALPPASLKVIVAIHWEALRLWMKKLKLFRRPAPPADDFSTSGASSVTHSLELGHEQ